MRVHGFVSVWSGHSKSLTAAVSCQIQRGKEFETCIPSILLHLMRSTRSAANRSHARVSEVVPVDSVLVFCVCVGAWVDQSVTSTQINSNGLNRANAFAFPRQIHVWWVASQTGQQRESRQTRIQTDKSPDMNDGT